MRKKGKIHRHVSFDICARLPVWNGQFNMSFLVTFFQVARRDSAWNGKTKGHSLPEFLDCKRFEKTVVVESKQLRLFLQNLLRQILFFPLLVLRKPRHYWTYLSLYFSRGLKQMEDHFSSCRLADPPRRIRPAVLCVSFLLPRGPSVPDREEGFVPRGGLGSLPNSEGIAAVRWHLPPFTVVGMLLRFCFCFFGWFCSVNVFCRGRGLQKQRFRCHTHAFSRLQCWI